MGANGIYIWSYDSGRGEDHEWVRYKDNPNDPREPFLAEYYRRVRVYVNGTLVREYIDGKLKKYS